MYLNRVLPNKNSILQHICNSSRWKEYYRQVGFIPMPTCLLTHHNEHFTKLQLYQHKISVNSKLSTQLFIIINK